MVVDFDAAPALEPRHASRVSDQQGERVTFKVDGDAPGFVADLTASYVVRDLIVEHPPIEEIVADLYSRAAGD